MTVENRRIYLSWQSPADGRRYIVGRLDQTQGRYRFVYTQGVKNRRFLPVMGMSDLHRAYESDAKSNLFRGGFQNFRGAWYSNTPNGICFQVLWHSRFNTGYFYAPKRLETLPSGRRRLVHRLIGRSPS